MVLFTTPWKHCEANSLFKRISIWNPPSCSEKDHDCSDARQLSIDTIRDRWTESGSKLPARLRAKKSRAPRYHSMWTELSPGQTGVGVTSPRWSSLIGAVSGRVVRSKVTNGGGLNSCPTFCPWKRVPVSDATWPVERGGQSCAEWLSVSSEWHYTALCLLQWALFFWNISSIEVEIRKKKKKHLWNSLPLFVCKCHM